MKSRERVCNRTSKSSHQTEFISLIIREFLITILHASVPVAMRLILASLLLFLAWASEEESKSPPAFFLIDGSDQLCLAGEAFKRCSIDSLFYVVGSPGESLAFHTAHALFRDRLPEIRLQTLALL